MRAGRRFVNLVLCVLMVSGIGLSATLTELVVSNVQNESSCTAGPAVSTFAPTDTQVVVYFKINDMLIGDTLHAEWMRPNGTLASDALWPPRSSAGNWCFSTRMNIAGTTVATTPGVWKVRIIVNDSLVTTATFTITAGTAGGATDSNLITNGSAESGPANCDAGAASIPGWNTDGRVAVCSYAAGDGFPTAASPGSPNRGANFFAGGPSSAASSMTQQVDVSAMAAQIDGGSYPYTLSAYLGGYQSHGDNAKITITFRSGFSAALGTAVAGPATSAQRNNTTGMILKTATGAVPTGTRTILVKVDFARTDGSYNDGYADDISLILGSGGGGGGGAGGSCPVTGANLLQNGSFEQPGYAGLHRVVGAGDAFITGWSVPSGSVDYIASTWSASDGVHSIDLNGAARGAVSQVISTVAGSTYTVCFDLAGNPTLQTTKQMEVTAAGQAAPFTFDVTGRSASSMGWTTKSWTFTANSSQTTIKLASTMDGNAGAAVDNVRVIGAAGGGGGGGTPGCDYFINPDKQSVPAAGYSGFVLVSTSSGCAVTATSNVGWIVVDTVGSSGVSYTVQPNSSSAPRTGTITIANRTFTVTQAGAPACTYSISPASASVGASGGSGSVSVTASATSCTWSVSSGNSWISFSGGSSRTGSGSVSYTVSANPDTVMRTGSLTVAGKTFSVTQAAGGAAGGGPQLSGAVNAASYTPSDLPGGGLAQGSFFSLFGADIGPDQWQQATSFPLPTTGGLGGVVVQIRQGGTVVTCALHFASKSQINGIIPSNAPLGNAEMVLIYQGREARVAVKIVKHNFGVFTLQAGRGPGIVQNWNSQVDVPLNTIGNPARPGQIGVIWGTGLGPITSPDNMAPPAGNLPFNVKVTVAGRNVKLLYWGRAPGASGVDNVYIELPADIPQGCHVPVQVEVEGTYSNTVTMAIGQPGMDCSASSDIPFIGMANEGGKTGVIILLRASVDAEIEAENEQAIDKLDLEGEIGLGLFVDVPPYDTNSNDLLGLLPLMGTCQSTATQQFDLTTLLGDLGGVDLFGGLNPEDLPDGVEQPVYQGLDAGAGFTISGPAGDRLFEADEETPGIYVGLLGGRVRSITDDLSMIAAFLPPPFLDGGSYQLKIPGGAQVGPVNKQFTLMRPVTMSSPPDTINRSSGVTVNWSGSNDNQAVVIFGVAANENTDTVGGFFCYESGSKSSFHVPASHTSTLPQASRVAGFDDNGAALGIAVLPVKNITEFQASGLDRGLIVDGSIDLKTVAVQ